MSNSATPTSASSESGTADLGASYLAFEDFAAGQVRTGEPLTVTRADIVTFARAFDAQPLHLDEALAETTFAGRLIASGWHTAALGMRLLQAGPMGGRSSLGSPGIAELRWLKPVLPGDTLRVSIRIEETRASASKPRPGLRLRRARPWRTAGARR